MRRLPDKRGEPWESIRHYLEATFDVRLPPGSKIAWVAAQAAMGLKGMRFTLKHHDAGHLLHGVSPLARLDCGMAESFEHAKSLEFSLDDWYWHWKGGPEDIAKFFRHLVSRCSLQATSHTDPVLLDNGPISQPIFWPTGVIRTMSQERLGEVIDDNRDLMGIDSAGPIPSLPFLQFVSEILWRCCYIIESFRTMAPRGGLGLNLLSQPVEGLISFARKGHCYWPWLGPNIALDVFIFEKGILRENDPFKVRTSFLVRMYGMGIRDLKFLLRNPNQPERKEQLDTLHRCHILRAWLGKADSTDLTEQLEFCYYSMAASMRNNEQRRYRPEQETHEQRVKARQREFKILKIMVDRVWLETERNGGHRLTPVLLRRVRAGDGQIREGDWHLLEEEQQRILLGGQTRYHPKHREHDLLLGQWLPRLYARPFFSIRDLYSGLPLRVADTATLERLEEFINIRDGLAYHAPKKLEEFIEIHDYSMLEKPVTSLAIPPDTFAEKPKGAYEQYVDQEIQEAENKTPPREKGYEKDWRDDIFWSDNYIKKTPNTQK
ncbi:hypothetical protein PG997_003010 [Apiospora hydei]|uniref:Uncharacterized protein n=1 Tax=Apiospora hydei TaxID=1337664 RepID=A0ABR1WY23_9PEZI